MIFAIDFDGTCVEHQYPNIGLSVPYAVSSLLRLVEGGHKLILYTMRSDEYLADAVNWFKMNGIELWGVNVNPEQKEWTNSPKAYANKYIDDNAVGCPLRPGIQGTRPMVDWPKLMNIMGVFNDGAIGTNS